MGQNIRQSFEHNETYHLELSPEQDVANSVT